MALVDRLADYQRFEDVKLTSYWDPIGQCWTIGAGHTPATEGQTISMATAMTFLNLDDGQAQAALDADPLWVVWNADHSSVVWTWRAALDDARRDAVIELAFNMGEHTLDEFVDMHACILKADWAGAAAAARASAWYDEVNGDGRGDFICNLLATGVRP